MAAKKPKSARVTAMAKVITALGISGAVISLDAARWRLRLRSLEPGTTNNRAFVCEAAKSADAELSRVIDSLVAALVAVDPDAAKELEREREQCAAVREGRWRTPFVGGEVYDHSGDAA